MKLRVRRGGYTFALPLRASQVYVTAEVEAMVDGYLCDRVCESVFCELDNHNIQVLPGESRLAAALACAYHNTCVHEQWKDDEALNAELGLGRETSRRDVLPFAPPAAPSGLVRKRIVAVEKEDNIDDNGENNEDNEIAQLCGASWADVVRKRGRKTGVGRREDSALAGVRTDIHDPDNILDADSAASDAGSWDEERDGERVVYDDTYEMNADIVHGTQLRRDRFEYYDELYA